MRKIVVATAVAVLVAATAAGCSDAASAGSCAAKTIDLGDPALHPGAAVSLSVDWMTETCQDTGGVNRPARHIAVTITSMGSGEKWTLGTIDEAVGQRFTALGRFTIPEDMPAGKAVLAVASPVGDGESATRPVVVIPR